ncbi:MAG: glycosyltransferase [Flavobacteriaceae bacterium]|nr:glycosyltransferase [Flavobacteriaceae bacterium]
MLSVLIPTYNYVVVTLVKSLHKQLKRQDISFEIICFDNGSKSKTNIENEQINTIDSCLFVSLEKNGGRSKIRNLLAEKTKYNWLLFLDADVLPVSKNFINNYLKFAKINNPSIIYGGLKYDDKKPSDDKLLRWVYGRDREEVSLKTRKLDSTIHFSSANFLIDKGMFQKNKFDESLVEYGHEDTLFAINLKRNNRSIIQIDNPVYHLGLDKTEQFIVKTKDSIKNLLSLQNQKKISFKENKLLKSFEDLKRIRMNHAFSSLFKFFSKRMEQNLHSKKPSVFIYNLYKLGYICTISKK